MGLVKLATGRTLKRLVTGSPGDIDEIFSMAEKGSKGITALAQDSQVLTSDRRYVDGGSSITLILEGSNVGFIYEAPWHRVINARLGGQKSLEYLNDGLHKMKDKYPSVTVKAAWSDEDF